MIKKGLKMNNKWDTRFLKIAKSVSTWSKDPTSKIGAVIVDQNNMIIAQGYNGFPKGVADLEERYEDKVVKNNFVVHAEVNAILSAGHKCIGSTIYVHGKPVCHNCAKIIIQSGIKRVIMNTETKNTSQPWKESGELTLQMFNEAGIEYEFIT